MPNSARYMPRIVEGLTATTSAHWLKPVTEPTELPSRKLYRALRAYYLNNSLYHEVQSALEDLGYWQESMEPLRNPAYRVVEFYTAKLWPGHLPGALEIDADNDRIVEPIQRVWRWSNWSVEKQRAARWFSLYGDWFAKVAQPTGEQVFIQNIDPEHVIDFMVDHRGFVTYIRVDTPQQDRDEAGDIETWVHTEVWDKDNDSWRVWRHDRGVAMSINRLGDPDEDESIRDAFGFDFVPFVYTPFRVAFDMRGLGSFTVALHKIDEANRQATRLHQMLFRHNRVEKAVESDNVDADGRPMPPPDEDDVGGKIEVADEQMWRLPGGWKIRDMVPNLNYAAALDILNAQMIELEADLPELAYYRLMQETRELSGRAVRMLLGPARDRVLEARGNAEAALARANAMALTIAQLAGLDGYSEAEIGTFDAGDFDHQFEERPVIDISEFEESQADETRGKAALLYNQLGISRDTVIEYLGFDPIQEAQRREVRAESAGAGLLQAAENLAAFDRGNGAEPEEPEGEAELEGPPAE